MKVHSLQDAVVGSPVIVHTADGALYGGKPTNVSKATKSHLMVGSTKHSRRTGEATDPKACGWRIVIVPHEYDEDASLEAHLFGEVAFNFL